MQTFDKFLDEADISREEKKRLASGGAGIYGGVGGIAKGVASAATGNLSGVWEVIKSTLQAYKGIVETSGSLSKISKIEATRKSLIAYISRINGEHVANEYAEIVFDVDENIIPLIPPTNWDEIVTSFVEGLNGKIDDYRNLTFNHAVSTVLSKNLDKIKGIAATQAARMDANISRLEKQNDNPLKKFIAYETGKPAPVTKEREQQARDASGEGEPAASDPNKSKHSIWKRLFGNPQEDEALKGALALLWKEKYSGKFDGKYGADVDAFKVMSKLRDRSFAKYVIKVLKETHKSITPESIAMAAYSILHNKTTQHQNNDNQDYGGGVFGGPPA